MESQRYQDSSLSPGLPGYPSRSRSCTEAPGAMISGRGTVLLVDDEPVLRRVAARLLEKLGYQVIQAADGFEALAFYRERAAVIDLVLMDLVMPGMNGYQTLEGLQLINPQVRVLLSSGYAEPEGQDLPPRARFISKPYTLEVLSKKIAAALGD